SFSASAASFWLSSSSSFCSAASISSAVSAFTLNTGLQTITAASARPTMLFIRLFIQHLLYFQVFTYCKETSEETDADTHYQSDRKKDLIYRSYRKEINDILQDPESGNNIFNCFIIKEIQKRQRDRSTEDTDDQTFDHERRPHYKVL